MDGICVWLWLNILQAEPLHGVCSVAADAAGCWCCGFNSCLAVSLHGWQELV